MRVRISARLGASVEYVRIRMDPRDPPHFANAHPHPCIREIRHLRTASNVSRIKIRVASEGPQTRSWLAP